MKGSYQEQIRAKKKESGGYGTGRDERGAIQRCVSAGN